MRWPQFKPENKSGVLVEVTGRVHGGRSLMVPSPEPKRFNEVVVGVMGRALEVSPIELCGSRFARKLSTDSRHAPLVATVGLLSRELNRAVQVARGLGMTPEHLQDALRQAWKK